MVYFLKKLTHYITANSRHGTHSPFVYALADELIYNKNIRRSKSLIEDVVQYYVSRGISQDKFIITDFNSQDIVDLAKLQEEYFMLFVKNIHHTDTEHKWEQMQKDERFVVLIDLFEFGIVCKRKEQPKEYFKLRYPYFLY
ncbi:MAG: hypothetical protein ACI35V_01230 [Sphingobacterium composti]|uniref:hypothetical protein n=1 Tax=Sphingobacterium composti TaxID=363260 RepID=UPI001356C69C|nr:hypothetical protein [Sphingobacterium composti Ten et al. 2007 non Yoo et al. 2007]